MKILSLGSLNLDHVYAVDHFVRAGETIASTKMENFCGGKGLNQSIALSRGGAQVFHAGRVGADGEVLRERLAQSGVDTAYTVVDPTVPTGHAIIQVEPKGQNCIIIFGGANQTIDPPFIDDVVSQFEQGDIALFQNEISNLDYAIERAAKQGMQVALNPSPINEALRNSPSLKYVKWFILNEIEGYELSGEKEPQAICEALHKKYPGSIVVLTLGKQGVLYSDGTTTARHGIYNVPVVDTTAAGDTFAGFFLACTARGLSVERTLELASKASSLAVSRPGASDSIPTIEEVETTGIQLAK